MPMYSINARMQATIFEKIMKYSDKPLKNCPDCGAKNSTRTDHLGTGFTSRGRAGR